MFEVDYSYIFQNMYIPDCVERIVEPFVGNGELLNFIDCDKYIIEMYDIKPSFDSIWPIVQDTLKYPPCYTNKFVLANPPFLARKRNKNKELYDSYNCDDLYKCFITTLIEGNCQGGIIVVPLNFLCSINSSDINLRRRFLEKYAISIINIFEEVIFNNAKYPICSISFMKRMAPDLGPIKTYIYPNAIVTELTFLLNYKYIIGGELHKLPRDPKYIIGRATNRTMNNITNILLQCIDISETNRLGFRIVYDNERIIDDTPNLTLRTHATLVINRPLSIEKQIILVIRMNNFIEDMRKKYNSLFLTHHKEMTYKRITFKLAFRICNYIMQKMALD